MISTQKIKYLASGIIIGSLLSSTVAFAEPAEYLLKKISYPIIVNGVEYNDSELPILNYNDNTYVPLGKLGNLLNCNIKWNNELNRVEIGEVSNVSNTSNANTNTNNNINNDTKFYNKNYILFAEINGTTYAAIHDLANLSYDKGYNFGFDKTSNTANFQYNPYPGHPIDQYKTLLDNIEIIIINDRSFIDYNFYLSNIVPLIK